ncbi:MAG TPA: YciI family protein [Thermoanaerobaculia bacterium]
MPQFVLMLRDAGSFPADMSPEEMQEIFERYGAWMQKVRATGEKLHDREGRVMVRKDSGVAVTDGPYAEAKEVIGGYFIIEADDYETAARLSEDCPHLEFGSIEIRRIEVMQQ